MEVRVPAAIGMRGYCIKLRRRGDASPLPINTPGLQCSVPEFFQKFFLEHTSATTNEQKERMWFFEEKQRGNRGDSQGYIRYGTFGFEAHIVDGKTKERNYLRKTTDVEQIPLFYDLWFPEGAHFALMAFQSFQGRSCKELVYSKMREDFEGKNPGFSLGFSRLMPALDSRSPFGEAPVKRIVFRRRRVSADDADNYLPKNEIFDVEVSIKAQGRGILGKLSFFLDKMKAPDSGLLSYEGKTYEEALAEVKIGKKIRRIGLTDSEGDFGIIDLTENINFGPDGHPELLSISCEVRDILKVFHDFLREEKS